MALEPITRQEKIIAGQDLTPITRMEKFLKQFGGGGSGGDTVLGTNGKLLNSVLPDGYPYSEVDTDGVIVETQTVNEPGGVTIASGTPVIGETYTVMIDGASYKCVAWVEPDRGYICIGNGNYVGVVEIGEDVPFAFAFTEGTTVQYIIDAGSECTFSIRGFAETIHPLDKKFVPVNLNGHRNFNFYESSDTAVTGGATPDDLSQNMWLGVLTTNKQIRTPLCVNVDGGVLGFPNYLLSYLVILNTELNLSTFTEQTFQSATETGKNKLLMLDIRDADSKKRFFIDVGFPLLDGYPEYTGTIEKIVPMNGINYLITVTGKFNDTKGRFYITIKKLSAVT